MSNKLRGPDIQEQGHTFSGGMNKDTAVASVSSAQYVDAVNAELLQLDGLDAEASEIVGRRLRLSNVRGQQLLVELPSIPESSFTQRLSFCWPSISLTPPGLPDPTGYQLSISFQSAVFGSVSISVSEVGGSLQTLENKLLSLRFELLAAVSLQLGSHYFSAVDILEVGVDEYSFCLTLTQLKNVDNQDFVSASPITSSLSILDDSTPVRFSGAGVVSITDVTLPAQPSPAIIGWRATATKLCIISADSSSLSPSPVAASKNLGQVWVVDISNYERLSAYTSAEMLSFLRYNGRLNLSLRHQCEVRVVEESDCDMFVFWTDNFNPPRCLRIKNGTRVFSDGGALDFSPAVASGSVEFVGHGQGSLLVGVRSYYVRGITQSGSATPWFAFTRPVNTTRFVPNGPDRYYATQGSLVGENSLRSNRIRISGISLDVESIEVAAAYYASGSPTPTSSFIIFRGAASGGSLDFEHVSDSQVVAPITLAEIITQFAAIARAKSILITNGRTFLANYCSPSLLSPIPQSAFSLSTFTKDTIADVRCSNDQQLPPPNWVGEQAPFTGTLNDTPAVPGNVGLPNPDYLNQQMQQIGDSITANYLMSYWRGERYRMGIVAEGAAGETLGTFWAGDITTPSIASAPLSYSAGSNRYNLSHLGIELTVDLGVLDSDGVPYFQKVKRLRVVRARRGTADSSVIAQGFAVPSFELVPANPTFPEDNGTRALRPFLFDAPASIFPVPQFSQNLVFFYSPDTDMEVATPAAGSFLQTAGALQGGILASDDNWVIFGQPGVGFANGIGQKFYEAAAPLPALSAPIVNSSRIGLGGEIVLSGIRAKNRIRHQIASGIPTSVFGSSTALLIEPPASLVESSLRPPMAFLNNGDRLSGLNSTMTICEIRQRGIVPYGGDGEAAIRATAWEETGYGIEVDPSAGSQVYAIRAFGGDCFLGVYTRMITDGFKSTPPEPQTQATFSARGASAAVGLSSPGIFGTLFAFPCQSNINFRLRDESEAPAKTNNPRKPDRLVDYWGGASQVSTSEASQSFFAGYASPVPLGFSSTDFGIIPESFRYDETWSTGRRGTSAATPPTVTDAECRQCFPNYVIASAPRQIGDEANQYVQMQAAEVLEKVNPVYGPINHLVMLPEVSAATLYALQDLAVARTFIDAPTQQVGDAAQIVIGVGSLFGPVTYLTVHAGTLHKWSVAETAGRFHFYDAANRSHVSFGTGSGLLRISDVRGFSSWLNSRGGGLSLADNPALIGGYVGGYDADRREYHLTRRAPNLRASYALSGAGLSSNFSVSALLLDGINVLESPITVAGSTPADRVANLALRLTDITRAPWTSAFQVLNSPVLYESGGVWGALTAAGVTATLSFVSAPPSEDDEWTVRYSDQLDCYVSRMDYIETPTRGSRHPALYLDMPGPRLLSISPNNLGQAYQHNALDLRNRFYGQTISRETSVTIMSNLGPLLGKVMGYIQTEMNDAWDEISALAINQRDIGGGEHRFRGTLPFSDWYQPRGGRWQGPIPPANEEWLNGAWLPADEVYTARMRGEQVFIRLSTQSSGLRDIGVIGVYIVPSKRTN